MRRSRRALFDRLEALDRRGKTLTRNRQPVSELELGDRAASNGPITGWQHPALLSKIEEHWLLPCRGHKKIGPEANRNRHPVYRK